MANKSFVFTLVLLLLVASVYFGPQITGAITTDRPTMRIATWNIENFGEKKATNDTVMDGIAEIIKKYDVVAIQEISNIDERIDPDCARNEDACPGPKCNLISNALLERLESENYSVIISDQVKDERYAFVFDKDVVSLISDHGLMDDVEETGSVCDLKAESHGAMNRQPYRATFKVNDWEFSLLTAHTSPSKNRAELEGLQGFFTTALQTDDNTILLGDLNADCSYMPKEPIALEQHLWVIPDTVDTTVSKTDCAYDRIIIPNTLKSRFAKQIGVDNEVTNILSDHYTVWADFYID